MTTFYLCIHQLMDIWFVSTFWLLQVMLPWTLIYKVLCGHMFAFLLVRFLLVELLGIMAVLCLTSWEIAKLVFQRGCSIFHSNQQCTNVPFFPQYLCFKWPTHLDFTTLTLLLTSESLPTYLSSSRPPLPVLCKLDSLTSNQLLFFFFKGVWGLQWVFLK